MHSHAKERLMGVFFFIRALLEHDVSTQLCQPAKIILTEEFGTYDDVFQLF